jgi:hypothetical protein
MRKREMRTGKGMKGPKRKKNVPPTGVEPVTNGWQQMLQSGVIPTTPQRVWTLYMLTLANKNKYYIASFLLTRGT